MATLLKQASPCNGTDSCESVATRRYVWIGASLISLRQSQAEERAGCKGLRAELGPLCLAKLQATRPGTRKELFRKPLVLSLQAGQRLLWESDFTSKAGTARTPSAKIVCDSFLWSFVVCCGRNWNPSGMPADTVYNSAVSLTPCFCIQVIFQEAQLGHLRFFEPAGQAVAQTVLGDSSGQKFEKVHTLCQVQLYHLRMQEFLAAEVLRGVPVSACFSKKKGPRLTGPVGGCPGAGLERSLRRSAAAADAARPAHPQSHFCKICVVTVIEDTPTARENAWLQLRSPTGALRFCLMMQTAHAAEAEIDLGRTALVAADAEAFQGLLLHRREYELPVPWSPRESASFRRSPALHREAGAQLGWEPPG